MFDERSFYNPFIYNVGVLRTLHINGPNWFDNDFQNTTQKTGDSEIFQEKFEDTKTRKSKDRQHNGQKKKKIKGQTTIYKTIHRKLKIRKYFKKGLKISKMK